MFLSAMRCFIRMLFRRMRFYRYRVFFPLILFFSLTLLLYTSRRSKASSRKDRPHQGYAVEEWYSKIPQTVTILAWTPFFLDKLGECMQRISRHQCPQYNCRFIDDRRLETEARAIVFHSRDIKLDDLPKERRWWQHYVYLIKESPHHTGFDLRRLSHGFFNRTMTHRIDSDFDRSYVRFLPRSAGHQPNQIKTTTELLSLTAKKTKLIAWFVSRCEAPSERRAVVNKLQRYIAVDIYGKCGPLDCGPEKSPALCNRLVHDYKFYVAFENSACVDYVTEKFARLRHFVVPLVLRASDYRNVAPAGSFIAVDQFPSIYHLADYLLYLDKNPQEYIKYFDWHKTLYVSSASMGYCQLCEMLINETKPEEKTYDDLYGWWMGRSECKRGIGGQLANRTRDDFLNTLTERKEED